MQKQTNYFLAVLTIIGFAILTNVNTQCINDNANPTGNHIREFNKGQLQFTTDLLLTLNQLSPYKNVFVSPHSIYNTFLLAYFGSQKATKTTFEVSKKLKRNEHTK
jgi:serine protease inhibitor